MAFWQFWVDRGGTFTDIVARNPQGQLLSHKLLSENPKHYSDAASHGIARMMRQQDSINGITPTKKNDSAIDLNQISEIKVGTTVATNALLEGKGEPTLLVTSFALKDAITIAGQTRPDIFAIHVELPKPLYCASISAVERVLFDGTIAIQLDELALEIQLKQYRKQGIKSVAFAFAHSYLYPQHELIAADIARQLGFKQISLSHQVSPLIKLIPRAQTTVLDAYLTPVLHGYINNLKQQLGFDQQCRCELSFMQSNGGLAQVENIAGKDAVLSGPAGGIVGMVETARADGFNKIIGFDMGGTSTDVSHFAESKIAEESLGKSLDKSSEKKFAEYERNSESQLQGLTIRTPMLNIHTVAAGGGSIINFSDGRFQVGPASAGAYPGPCGYGNGGPLTVTDCNILLGKVRAEYFPKCFGHDGQQALDENSVRDKFLLLTDKINQQQNLSLTAQQVAIGFLQVAVDNMAAAVKKISVQRGYDIEQYTLNAFGGAGAQHACLLAEQLNVKQVYLHPMAGVLSAYGIGLASERWLAEESLLHEQQALLLSHSNHEDNNYQERLSQVQDKLLAQGTLKFSDQLEQAEKIFRLHAKYQGTDNSLLIKLSSCEEMQQEFHQQHKQLFGFSDELRTIELEALQLEIISGGRSCDQWPLPQQQAQPIDQVSFYSTEQDTPVAANVYRRSELAAEQNLLGPAIIIEDTSTIVIEAAWQVKVLASGALLLNKKVLSEVSNVASANLTVDKVESDYSIDPIRLEIFNNVFMAAAEQMGLVLEKTAVSVNIKERLDFSCAIFDREGELVANAPHIPVHLGSMSESIKAVMEQHPKMQVGDAFILNTPYNGGTHLPDITVVKPVFFNQDNIQIDNGSENQQADFYVASRGHHADIGGITPGSMPAHSTHIEQEGILLDNLYLVKAGVFQQQSMQDILSSSQYPARNIKQNLADLKAQLAACETGSQALISLCQQYGRQQVHFYMQAVQDNAEQTLRAKLSELNSGKYTYVMDDGSQISVAIEVIKDPAGDISNNKAIIDFAGTSAQHKGNFNAPSSVAKAAVLYVFRCLVNKPMPLNAGFFRALEIKIPANSMLSPKYPAAVVSGNVETAQYIVDTLLAALGVMAGSQGTNNNFTFGNEQYQYYETLCGGVGASYLGAGASAVHSHMTNSRLTDVEILEQRYPVVLEHFAIRACSQGTLADGINGFPGGQGVERHIRFLQPMQANIISGHRLVAPFVGGDISQLNEQQLKQAQGKTGVQFIKQLQADASIKMIKLSSCQQVELNAGDVFCLHTPGGGAYVLPADKDIDESKQ